MLAGFKEFISRGNAIDLAVGVVIGAAFTQVVTAIVEKVLNPLIGGIFGKPDFDNLWVITLGSGDDVAEVLPFSILTALINFLLVAAALYFLVVLPMNKLAARRKVEETEPAAPAEDVRVLTEIRDLLAAQQRGADGGATVSAPRTH
ncbi:large conductance mechanosensitive channel protein MscL [Georgenia sp. EYE_87]|uniref:large conductance mechanosensitive channel protein MscL n=1 Tax=Georgenia sp. EYE_87 TaxID=2853448 RepID=UPI0020043C41|nr:large conductance mechanosensitive channel protein MscL [Georgenia sp. EYE_87]MCK6211100.1 large conductance mechanosensitive channel protein MscL [Georgenia sp. EYE_87]